MRLPNLSRLLPLGAAAALLAVAWSAWAATHTAHSSPAESYVRTCVPADPQSKGGSEATVRIAKADLVPTDTNLLEAYRSFGDLETACREFCEQVNDRPHRETR